MIPIILILSSVSIVILSHFRPYGNLIVYAIVYFLFYWSFFFNLGMKPITDFDTPTIVLVTTMISFYVGYGYIETRSLNKELKKLGDDFLEQTLVSSANYYRAVNAIDNFDADHHETFVRQHYKNAYDPKYTQTFSSMVGLWLPMILLSKH